MHIEFLNSGLQEDALSRMYSKIEMIGCWSDVGPSWNSISIGTIVFLPFGLLILNINDLRRQKLQKSATWHFSWLLNCWKSFELLSIFKTVLYLSFFEVNCLIVSSLAPPFNFLLFSKTRSGNCDRDSLFRDTASITKSSHLGSFLSIRSICFLIMVLSSLVKSGRIPTFLSDDFAHRQNFG